MKTVKVSTDNKLSIIDVDFDNYRDIQKVVGGYFETVRTTRMADFFHDPYIIMLVDEEGIIKGLPQNLVGSILYGTQTHGVPLVGDLIFARLCGEDIVAPEDPEELIELLLKTFYRTLKETPSVVLNLDED